MNATLAVKRARCARCLRPHSACICQWVTPVVHRTEVLILQHPMEVNHAKNTARLLHMSLPHSRMLTGEAFDEASLRAVMAETKYTVLLYPATSYEGHTTPAVLDSAQLGDPSRVRLVVLDGTWRKSRKMLHQSPLLQSLPRLPLIDIPQSGYTIRKAHKPGQLSTLEATCAALAQLEGGAEPFQPLLTALDRFVAQQQGFAGQKSLQHPRDGHWHGIR